MDYEAGLPVDSPPLTLHSPALRVSAGKSGVEGVERDEQDE